MAAGRAWLLFVVLASTPPSPSPSPRPSPSPSPSPSASPPARPVSDSVDRVVNRIEDAREDPCKKSAQEGKPCFPVSTTVRGEEYSVRKSLGLPDLEKSKPVPGGAPTVAEMTPYRPGPKTTPVPLVKLDPGCLVKGLMKSLKGKNDTYYLYRVRDTHGERVALYDRKLDAENFQGEVAFLGKFEGECDALAAFRHEELIHPPSGAPTPRPWPSPSVTPSPR